jgi:hypothetical protein
MMENNQDKADLRKEQQLSLQRPVFKYSAIAKFFFWGMDFLTGKKHTLAKAKLLEMLACIPYREWEIKHYIQSTKKFRNLEKVKWSASVIEWGRSAQDNEFLHLLVIHEKMKEDGIKDPWFLHPIISLPIVLKYVLISKLLANFNINRAFLFNAEFEDHAEHVYAQLVDENPHWENEPLANDLVKQYADVPTWADVFRRIGLDERDHRNESLIFCGKTSEVVRYIGMPKSHYTK